MTTHGQATHAPAGPLFPRTAARRLREGFWRLADPKISTASIASMLLGTCWAAHDGKLALGWLALTVAGVFALEVAKNASGETFDFNSGADLAVATEDRSPFSGGKRVLVDHLLTRGETIAIAVGAYATGIGAGLAIALWREPRVLAIGVLGVACAYFYHAPPLRLSYRGLGELAVALCYGPLIAAGTYLVQYGSISPGIVLASVPLGLLIAAFLWVNEFPDYRADRAAGKRTLVVQAGRPRAAVLFAVLVGTALAWQATLPWLVAGTKGPAYGVLLGLAAALPAAMAARRLLATPEDTAQVIPAQRQTLLAFMILAIGSGLGILMS